MPKSILFRSFAVVGLMMASVAVLQAQAITELATTPVAVSAPVGAAPLGPVATQSVVALPVSAAESALEASMQSSRGTDRSNVAWMAVGAAALVVGLLIGGDAGSVVAITGGVIGLVGLFRYMN